WSASYTGESSRTEMTFGCITSLTRGERSLMSAGGSKPNFARTKSIRSFVLPARPAITSSWPVSRFNSAYASAEQMESMSGFRWQLDALIAIHQLLPDIVRLVGAVAGIGRAVAAARGTAGQRGRGQWIGAGLRGWRLCGACGMRPRRAEENRTVLFHLRRDGD